MEHLRKENLKSDAQKVRKRYNINKNTEMRRRQGKMKIKNREEINEEQQRKESNEDDDEELDKAKV